MRIQITLYYVDGNCILFDGAPADCPPIPRSGDMVMWLGKSYLVEGVRYICSESDTCEIQLLA